MALEVKGGRIVAINDLPFELVDGLVEYKQSEEPPAPPPPPPQPTAFPAVDVVALKNPASLGHAAKRWLSEAEACGFVLLGWTKVTIHTASTSVGLANADGSIVFFMFSRFFGGDFNPIGVEMSSYFPGQREVTTSLYPIPVSDPGRQIHRHYAKVSTIGELLREHQSHLARLNLDQAEASRTRSLTDLVALIEAEVKRKLTQGRTGRG